MREDESSGLAAGKNPELFLDVVSGEQDSAELGADVSRRRSSTETPQVIENGNACVTEQGRVVLREVSDSDSMAPAHGALVGPQRTDQDTEQRRLADTIGAQDRNTLPAPRHERHFREHRVGAVGLADPFGFEHVPAAGTKTLETETRHAAGGARDLGDLQSLDLLETTLGLACLRGLGAKALDERELLVDSFLDALGFRLHASDGGLFLLNELFVVARVERYGFVVDVEYVIDDVVQEPVVV